MITNEKTNVKEWYLKTYETDTLGNEIKSDIIFYDIFYTLDRYKNVYETIGVEDSVVRERIFTELAKIMQVDYNYVYSQWLECKE